MTRDAAVCLGQMTFGYEVALGARISRDPIAEEGGLNLYAYVLNAPARFVDPLGLDIDLPTPADVPALEAIADIEAELAGEPLPSALRELAKQARRLCDKELKKLVGDIHKAKDIMRQQFKNQLKGDKNFDVLIDKAGNAILPGNKTGTIIPTGIPVTMFGP